MNLIDGIAERVAGQVDAAHAQAEAPQQAVRIYCISRGAWWRPNRNGYTWRLGEAGLYSKAEATAIVRGARDRDDVMVRVYGNG